MNNQRLTAHGLQLLHGCNNLLFVQGYQHVAIGVHTLGDFKPEVAWYHRFKLTEHAIGLWSSATPQFDNIAKATRGDHTGARQLAFEYGVGGCGGAMHDCVNGR